MKNVEYSHYGYEKLGKSSQRECHNNKSEFFEFLVFYKGDVLKSDDKKF